MKKLQKVLLIIGIILISVGTVWMIISFIPPKQAVNDVNTWRKTDKTLISAHRGGANLNPENTEMAFDHVILNTSYTDIVEIDVRLTKDDELVIIHNESINETGINVPHEEVIIREHTYEELIKYNLGINFEDKNGVKIYKDLTIEEADELGLTLMTFEQFLDKYEASNVRLFLEIKDSKELGKKAVDVAEKLIAKYPSWDDRTMIISFSTDVINYTLENYKDRYVAGMGYNMVPFLVGSILGLDCFFDIKYQSIQSAMVSKAGPIEINCATQNFVDSAHARNQCVAYWTIDEESDMRYLIGLGVDVITTDSPDILASVLGKEVK